MFDIRSRARTLVAAAVRLALLAGALVLPAVTAAAPANVGVWRPLSGPFDPPATASSRAIHDARRHRMVLVDGDQPTRLWELQLDAPGPPAWRRVDVRGTEYPSSRTGFSAVYDSVRDAVWIYAGGDLYGNAYDDVWTLSLGDAPEWTRVSTLPGGPSPRSGHIAVLDTRRDRLIVYGGGRYFGAVGETYYSDTWQLSLAGEHAWSPLAAGTTAPVGRTGATGVYDPWNDRVVVYGGWTVGVDPRYSVTTGAVLTDAWELTFYGGVTAWSQLRTTAPPPPRHQHVAVLDPGGRRMLISAGNSWQWRNDLNDTWALSIESGRFNVLHEWTQLAANGASPRVYGHSAIYSPERGSMVQFGGVGDPNECFEFRIDAQTWSRLDAGVSAPYPPRRCDPALASPPGSDGLLLFGGGGCGHDLWRFPLSSGGDWQALASTGTAPSCGGSDFVFDAPRRRWLAFGCNQWSGLGGGCLLEVWALPLEEPRIWTPLAVSGPRPAGRAGQSLVFDPVRDRVLMFGGVHYARRSSDTGEDLDDVWALSLDEPRWFPLATANSPGARGYAWAGFDVARDRMVVVGGANSGFRSSIRRQDCWALALSGDSLRWSPLAPDAPGPANPYQSLGWPIELDALRQRLLLWDGGSGMWELLLAAPSAWTPLALRGEAPGARSGASIAYDERRDQLLMFGGSDGSARADLWALMFSQPMRARVLPSPDGGADIGNGPVVEVALLADAGFSPDSLDIATLTLAGAPVLDPLSAPGRLAQDPQAPPRWLDVDHDGRRDRVVQFAAHAMRLANGDTLAVLRGRTPNSEMLARLPVERGRLLAGTVRLPSATALRLALRSRAGEPLRVQFALPQAAPARLEIFDLLGRRVAERELAAAAVGKSEVTFTTGELRPGMYLVRLRQGARSVVARAVLMK